MKCTAVSCVPRPPLPLYTDRRGAGLAAAVTGWPDITVNNTDRRVATLPHCHTSAAVHHWSRQKPPQPPVCHQGGAGRGARRGKRRAEVEEGVTEC